MQDVNLYHLLKFYAKNWIWIVSITLIGLIVGFIYVNFVQTPMYKSEATLLLVRSSSSTDISTQDTVRINNYIELFKSRRVLEPVIKKQNINISYDNMVGFVDASNSKSTEVIRVSVSTDNAEKSKSFLESAIVSFKSQVEQLYKIDNVKVVDSASLASKAYNINKELVILLSAGISFFVTIVILFFIYDFKLVNSVKHNDPKTDKPERIENIVTSTPQVEAAPIVPLSMPIEDIEKQKPKETTVNESVHDNSRRVRERLFQTSYPRERYSRR